MAKKIILAIVAFVAAFAFIPGVASATNGHQDHRGACARSTTSISKGVGDLRYNGVLTKYAGRFGIKGVNGNIGRQMREQLVVGVVAKATTTRNEGCDGHGGTFGAGNRRLYKGEKVIIKAPAKYGKDVCTRSHKGCVKIKIKLKFVLPASCWNGNGGTIYVYIWVKKAPKPTPKPKPKPTPKPKPKPTPKQPGDYCSGDNSSNGSPGAQTGNCNYQGDCNGVNNCNTNPPPCTAGCTPTPPCPQGCVTEKSVRITSWTDINDIPVGKSSDNFHIGVYASDEGGSLTIDPGVGGVGACGSAQPVIVTYTVSLQKGNNDVCVKLFAPQDATATTMTVTATVMLGNKSDSKSQTFPISRPTRPE